MHFLLIFYYFSTILIQLIFIGCTCFPLHSHTYSFLSKFIFSCFRFYYFTTALSQVLEFIFQNFYFFLLKLLELRATLLQPGGFLIVIFRLDSKQFQQRQLKDILLKTILVLKIILFGNLLKVISVMLELCLVQILAGGYSSFDILQQAFSFDYDNPFSLSPFFNRIMKVKFPVNK